MFHLNFFNSIQLLLKTFKFKKNDRDITSIQRCFIYTQKYLQGKNILFNILSNLINGPYLY